MSNVPEKNSCFLDVDRSASDQKWIDRLDNVTRNVALDIAQSHDVPELVARVMAGRGVSSDGAMSFLNPTIRDLMPDPSVLSDMDKAAERLSDAIMAGERVAIFGDYDVDGAASSALMSRFLGHHAVPSEIYIPDRIFEGYGPNPNAINELIDKGAKLIVTVDCGATSFEALEAAEKRNIDVIVIDHHQMGTEMPPAVALVNPNRQDDLSGLGYLCAAGVVFLTLVATARVLRGRAFYKEGMKAPDLLQMLDIVALATVCDVVPLVGLNRALVVKGLTVMHAQQNFGLRELAKIARLDGPASPYHLGFMLGPRINAGGRIGDAALGARLLCSDDPHEAQETSEQLEMLNRERQAAEATMLEQAIAEADAEIGDGEGPAVLVTESDHWHPGIVGLLASRLKDRFHRPTFAIAFDAMGKGSGSGRSISGVDIGSAVRAAVDAGILVKGGGHAMAAGLTVEREKLGALRAFLDEQLSQSVQKVQGVQTLKIDGALTAGSATLKSIEMLEHAGPYGAGHPSPIFAFPAHRVQFAKIVGKDHVSVTLASGDGAKLRAIAFRAADTPVGKTLLNMRGHPIHIAGTLGVNIWQGTKNVQLRIMDVAEPKF
ncbi:MAG: single-stranded-DNA-specific exonuclease RecJ [Rhizobiaceae bacterium]|nr:single-stranded-DNA-specific exonuclease RecJ [Rhizobiaceae bacterium]